MADAIFMWLGETKSLIRWKVTNLPRKHLEAQMDSTATVAVVVTQIRHLISYFIAMYWKQLTQQNRRSVQVP
jgi:hypothetical protein